MFNNLKEIFYKNLFQMQLKTIAFLIADSLKCQEKTLFFLPYLSSLSEVYKNKIIIKYEWEAQMKSYKLVDNVDKLVYNYFLP